MAWFVLHNKSYKSSAHKEFWLNTLRLESCFILYRTVDMKGLLIISFLVLHLLYAAKAQDECIRSTTSQVSVDVSWCNVPATATLPSPMVAGYCANARCKSAHMTHPTPEKVDRGSSVIVAIYIYLCRCTHVVVDIL